MQGADFVIDLKRIKVKSELQQFSETIGSTVLSVKHYILTIMVKNCESWIPPSPNLDKVTISFELLNNTDEYTEAMAFIHRVD